MPRPRPRRKILSRDETVSQDFPSLLQQHGSIQIRRRLDGWTDGQKLVRGVCDQQFIKETILTKSYDVSNECVLFCNCSVSYAL